MATGQVRRREGLSGPHGPDPRPTPRAPMLDLASLQPFLLHALRSRRAGALHHSPGRGRLKRSAPPFGPMLQMRLQGSNDSVAELGKRRTLAISRSQQAECSSGSLWPGICRSYGAHPPLSRKRTAPGRFAMIGLTLLFLFGVLPAAVVIYAVVVSRDHDLRKG